MTTLRNGPRNLFGEPRVAGAVEAARLVVMGRAWIGLFAGPHLQHDLRGQDQIAAANAAARALEPSEEFARPAFAGIGGLVRFQLDCLDRHVARRFSQRTMTNAATATMTVATT